MGTLSRRRPGRLAAALLLLAAIGCAGERAELSPTRGYLLISVDGLRTDRLAAWGGDGSAAPAIDRFAAHGAGLTNVFTPDPDTLPAVTSILTGLLPDEHGVRPPGLRLSRQLPTLPERFAARGFTTAGFTTSTWLTPPWGGDRGFDRYRSLAERELAEANTAAIQETLRHLDSDHVESLDGSARFFVYLQLRLVDADDEEAGWVDGGLGDGNTGASPDDAGRNETGANDLSSGQGASEGRSESAAALELDRQPAIQRYDDRLRRLDDELATLFDRLAELDLLRQTTVVLTAAHGHELGEHGRFGHAQVYPETSRVPLVVRHPDVEPGTTVDAPLQTIDLAATLAAAARLAPGPPVSGIDLAPLLLGTAAPAAGRVRIDTGGMRPQRALVVAAEGAVTMVVRTTHVAETDGTWVSRTATFDADRHDERIEIVSFDTPRTVAIAVDGEPVGSYEVPTRWLKAPLPGAEGGGRRRITLSTPECDVPARLGGSFDPRCLSFKVRGPKLTRLELFDLETDPGAAVDVGERRPRRRRELADELERHERLLLARPEPVPRKHWPGASAEREAQPPPTADVD